MPENTPILEAKDIWKDFATNSHATHVLENIDLAIYPNEVVAIIGPSGCGKSTLLRILAGLVLQTKGTVLSHGQELKGLLPNMSMVFQTFGLYPWMTAKENIEAVLKAARVGTDDMEKRVKDAIALIGLEGYEDAYPRELSGGMKQRIGIARALVCQPEILFMDEPFNEIDSFTGEVLRSEIINIWTKKAMGLSSILIASHDLNEVAFMADRIVVLSMHPAKVRAVIENKIKRPRDYHSEEFLDLRERLHDTYAQAQPQSTAVPPKKEKGVGPLLPVPIDQIIGCLSYLFDRGSSQEIFKIGTDSHLHFDKVTLVLQAAELFGFLEISHRTATLTPKGIEFLKGDRPSREKIWKEQLLTFPLFAQFSESLKKGECRSRDDLIALIQKELPYQNPQTQLHIFIRWGQYGKLFTYNPKSGQFKSL